MSNEISIDDYRHDRGTKGNYTISTVFYEDGLINFDNEVVGSYGTAEEMINKIQNFMNILINQETAVVELLDISTSETRFRDAYSVLKVAYNYKATNKTTNEVVLAGIIYRIYGRSKSETDDIRRGVDSYYDKAFPRRLLPS